jgi:hypothetical protein
MPEILVFWEAETGKIEIPGQFRKKIKETPSHSVSQVYWLMPISPTTPGRP